ncbi:MAG: uracil-DNA glycosylase [Candidatus Omnitrophica bacterium]|nr:uracil-DNA glycosylase [Candidatus Omnitrophota bacterium]
MTPGKKIIELARKTKGYLKRLEEEGVKQIPAAGRTHLEGSPKPMPDGAKGLTPRERLIELKNEVEQCVRCEELAKTRHSVVFGAGHAEAKLCFVGEAPGYDEDQQGLPFVGRAGQLLTKIIESIGLSRKQVFICNVLKCRPPQNRNPLPDEILNCEPYLVKQLEIIKPRVICALGNFAAQTLLKTGKPVSQLRGNFHDYHGIPVMVTFHPAYLLRNPDEKRKVWEDMKRIKSELNRLKP